MEGMHFLKVVINHDIKGAGMIYTKGVNNGEPQVGVYFLLLAYILFSFIIILY